MLSFSQAGLKACVRGLLVVGLLSWQPLLAQDDAPQDAKDAIRAVLTETQPEMEIDSITLSPVPGLYEVTTRNLQSIFASADGRFFIPGDLFEAHAMGLVNRTDAQRNRLRAQRMSQVPESELIIYGADGETRGVVWVFTDFDCPYCRQLHGDIDTLNGMGIAVHYLAFPRTGMDSETADKMISAWCSDAPKAMLTSAKRGGDVPVADCDNPVASHYQLGREMGVRGTPALVLEDGYIINGYLPPETLQEYMFGAAQ